MAVTTALFGLADSAWSLDLARFCQGFASSFSWTGALAWLIGGSGPRPTRPLDRQGVRPQRSSARSLGPCSGVWQQWPASGLDVRPSSRVASLGVAAWAATTAGDAGRRSRPAEPLERSSTAVGDSRIGLAIWFVVLPALMFGTLTVLAPLRLASLGLGSLAIGAIWLVAGGAEALNSIAGREAGGPLRGP